LVNFKRDKKFLGGGGAKMKKKKGRNGKDEKPL